MRGRQRERGRTRAERERMRERARARREGEAERRSDQLVRSRAETTHIAQERAMVLLDLSVLIWDAPLDVTFFLRSSFGAIGRHLTPLAFQVMSERDKTRLDLEQTLRRFEPYEEVRTLLKPWTRSSTAVIDSGRDLSRRGTTRAEDAQGTPTQSHISPSILVYDDKPETLDQELRKAREQLVRMCEERARARERERERESERGRERERERERRACQAGCRRPL